MDKGVSENVSEAKSTKFSSTLKAPLLNSFVTLVLIRINYCVNRKFVSIFETSFAIIIRN